MQKDKELVLEWMDEHGACLEAIDYVNAHRGDMVSAWVFAPCHWAAWVVGELITCDPNASLCNFGRTLRDADLFTGGGLYSENWDDRPCAPRFRQYVAREWPWPRVFALIEEEMDQ